LAGRNPDRRPRFEEPLILSVMKIVQQILVGWPPARLSGVRSLLQNFFHDSGGRPRHPAEVRWDCP